MAAAEHEVAQCGTAGDGAVVTLKLSCDDNANTPPLKLPPGGGGLPFDSVYSLVL